MTNDLQSELQELEQLVRSLPENLVAPLHDLVLGQINLLDPYLRALFVLSAGIHDGEDPSTRIKRIYLAAALETLFLALNIHKHLLGTDSTNDDMPNNKPLIGSMILAGDYCFSRSAEFAAKTDNPVVVSIFSEALTTVSEGHLRHIHNDDTPRYDEVQDLVMAGVRASIELCQLPIQFRQPTLQISKELINIYSQRSAATTELYVEKKSLTNPPQTILSLPHTQQIRWKMLADLLN